MGDDGDADDGQVDAKDPTSRGGRDAADELATAGDVAVAGLEDGNGNGEARDHHEQSDHGATGEEKSEGRELNEVAVFLGGISPVGAKHEIKDGRGLFVDERMS